MTTRQAFLPESIEPQQPTVGTMVVGDRGYVTPWTMQVDSDRHCWLAANTEVYRQRGGTVCMLVERQADGWHVWAPQGESWRPRSSATADCVPVAEIHLGAT